MSAQSSPEGLPEADALAFLKADRASIGRLRPIVNIAGFRKRPRLLTETNLRIGA
jgi:hypothetical protein